MQSEKVEAPRLASLLPSGRSDFVGERYGLEIELEGEREGRNLALMNQTYTAMRESWDTTDDGSLRNGIELVSRPLAPAAVRAALPAAYAYADAYHRHPSARCGMHIHTNCAGYTAERLGQVLAAYILAEPYLFACVGEEREQNIYCVPWYLDPRQYRAGAVLVRELRDGPVLAEEARPGVSNVLCKYSALNLLPLFKQHTIEFRHAPAFATSHEALHWWEIVAAVTTKAGWVATRPDKLSAMRTIAEGFLTAQQLASAQERIEEYELHLRYENFVRESTELCTYKAGASWGKPASLMAEGVYRKLPSRKLGSISRALRGGAPTATPPVPRTTVTRTVTEEFTDATLQRAMEYLRDGPTETPLPPVAEWYVEPEDEELVDDDDEDSDNDDEET